MSAAPSILELCLPAGGSRHSVVVGDGAPPRLLPRPTGATGPVDLALLAPTPSQAANHGWLERAARELAGALGGDGVLHALVPRRARGLVIESLRQQGLEVTGVLHHPGWERPEYFAPLVRPALRHLARHLIPLAPSRRRVADIGLALPGAAATLERLHPGVILRARPRGARPLYGWLALRTTEPGARECVVGRLKHRGARGTAVLHILADGGALARVAKLALDAGDGGARAERELGALTTVGPSARAAGVTVPTAEIARGRAGWPALVESPVAGVPAAGLLESGTLPFSAMLDRLGTWLRQWSATTATLGMLDDAWLERQLRTPARALAGELADTGDYLRCLDAAGEALRGRLIPAVAAHGDLTMSNVLVDDAGGLGIVDWEAAFPDGLPLRDLRYAAVDAEAAIDHYRDRVGAFVRCFEAGGSRAAQVAGAEARLRLAVRIDDELDALCFHACWLQHAADELPKRGPGEPRPFLEIVRRIAARGLRPAAWSRVTS